MSIIFNFLKSNYKTILLFIIVGLISYVFLSNMSGVNGGSEYRKKIDSINTIINRIEGEQIKLDSNIAHYNQEIIKVDHNIEKIKIEKTTINNVYHEKINDVNNYTDDKLDSFFTIRYGYIPKH